MQITLPSLLFFGFLLVWVLAYWVFPSLAVRFRGSRIVEDPAPIRFLSETGTIHRLGRSESSEND
jgi:hypothetical protein